MQFGQLIKLMAGDNLPDELPGDTPILKHVLQSPALEFKHPSYPAGYKGNTPLIVELKEDVRSDLPFSKLRGVKGNFYPVWVNSYGAISIIIAGGDLLGVKPDEFDVFCYHEDTIIKTSISPEELIALQSQVKRLDGMLYTCISAVCEMGLGTKLDEKKKMLKSD